MLNRKVVLTGSTGVLGKKFIQKNKNNKFLRFKVDITNKSEVFSWIKKYDFDIFIHFAAVVSQKKIKEEEENAYAVNFHGTKNITDAIIKYKKKCWFFFASSSHVYKFSNNKLKENSKILPHNLYGKSKFEAEKYIIKKMNKSNSTSTLCIGRICSFTDTNQNTDYFIPSVVKKIRSKKEKLKFINLNKRRDFIHTSEIIDAINILYKKNAKGIYNIASGKPQFLFNIVKRIHKLLKSKKDIYIHNSKREGDLVANIKKLEKLGWRSKITIDEIINDNLKIR